MNLQYGLTDEAFKLRYGHVWVENDSEIYGINEVNLIAGKNDTAAFQLVLKADENIAINVGTDPWFSQQGRLTVLRLEVVSELKATCQHIGMVIDDSLTETADILLNNPVLEIDAHKPHSIWIELATDKQLSSGIYIGQVNIYSTVLFEREQKIGSAYFTIEVKNVVIPSPKEWEFHLDLWQHCSNIARKAEVELWSDAHFRILEQYVATLAVLGQKAVTIIASEIPWSGQRCFFEHRTPANLYEYSMIRVRKHADGSFIYDYSAMQRYIDICAAFGIDRELEIFGLSNIWLEESCGFGKPCSEFPDGIRIRYLDVDGTYAYMDKKEQINGYIKSLEEYLKKMELIEKVRIVADEPSNIDVYRSSLLNMQQNAPSFSFKAAINHAQFIPDFDEQLDDVAPFLQCVLAEYDVLCAYKGKKRLLWYVCWEPEFPNTLIKSPLIEARLIGILTGFFQFNGFLRWNYTAWPEKPRQDIRYAMFPAGDTNFVYPAGDASPLLTLRWKLLRRGIVDFELIQKVLKLGKKEVLDRVYSLVLNENCLETYVSNLKENFKRETMYSQNKAHFSEAKLLLLTALEDSDLGE